jgi:DNA modification methylase
VKNTTDSKALIPGTARRLAVTYRPISELKLDPNNPRRHSPAQIRRIAGSMDTFGFIVPVLVDSQLNVFAGHGRVLAAQRLEWTEVPTIMIDHLSDTQMRAFMIADNRLTELSDWDDRVLAEQLQALSEVELDFDLEVTGFEMGEIDLRIEGLSDPTNHQDAADELPPPSSGPPVSRSGDLWLLGKNRLFCGNSLEPASYPTVMNRELAATAFADPPYNVRIDGNVSGLGSIRHREFAMASGEMNEREFAQFLRQSFYQLAANSVDGSLHYICMDWRHQLEVLAAGREVYSELKALCVWVKDGPGMGSLYRSQHELVFVYKHGNGQHRNNIQLGKYGRNRSNVWRYPGVNSFARNGEEGNLLKLHPTVKPVAMVADAIMDCTARGAIILDSYIGSGTTIIAAERTGRQCYGIEIDPIYTDSAIRRWQAFTGGTARHATSGRSFDDLEVRALEHRDE